MNGYKLPYTQQVLRKIYTIYTNGNMTVHNINTVLIADAQRFANEMNTEIPHELWHPLCHFPSFAEMQKIPIDRRKDKPFFRGILRQVNQKTFSCPLGITVKKQQKDRISLAVRFLDETTTPISVKNQDIVIYQYAWGLPKCCAVSPEQLGPLEEGGELNERAYNQAAIVASHATIRTLTLELRFERRRGELFSKSPFFQTASYFGSVSQWSQPEILPIVPEEDHEMWFQTYKVLEQNFQGKIRVLWRPARTEKEEQGTLHQEKER